MEPVGFQDAVMTGLARDGGLLLPAEIPDVRDRLGRWSKLSYPELACEVMGLFSDLPAADLRDLVLRAYRTFEHPEVAPVVPVGPFHVLELFHGPTLSFKDIALQFLGNLFEHILRRTGQELNIVAATSGDTGSAAIHGVRGRDRIRIFVMHPRGKVSPLQERQMTTVLDANVFNLAIEGTFDDCQRIMKSIFGDLAFKDRHSLGAVNSINWARVLAQIVYYFFSAFRVMERTGARRVRFSVPTGNFGDIFAGYVSARMGLPIGRLVLATNENDILARFFATGVYSVGPVHQTMSPSMDIQVASNFERYLYYAVGGDASRLQSLMDDFAKHGRLCVGRPSGGAVDPLFAAGAGSTKTTLETIRSVYAEHGYLLDPHTAVGVHVAAGHLAADEPMICIATAHPAKFPDAIGKATGRDDLARHPALDALAGREARCAVRPASVDEVRAFVEAGCREPQR